MQAATTPVRIAIMVLVMIVGTALDMTPTILILTPVLMPLVIAAKIDPVYFDRPYYLGPEKGGDAAQLEQPQSTPAAHHGKPANGPRTHEPGATTSSSWSRAGTGPSWAA